VKASLHRVATCALIITAALVGHADRSGAQQKVEARRVTATMKFQEVLSGHLDALNGNFKMRAVELLFEPDGSIGVHHHTGPGLRYVVAGELVFTQAGKSTIYKAGDVFYESGNVAHTAHNRTKSITRVLVFEIVPSSYDGPSSIVPKS
jgi:quercetin dioxygenase-like cupin family protein